MCLVLQLLLYGLRCGVIIMHESLFEFELGV